MKAYVLLSLVPGLEEKALSQIPRLLSLQDRNEFSRTYGCFNRESLICRASLFHSDRVKGATPPAALPSGSASAEHSATTTNPSSLR